MNNPFDRANVAVRERPDSFTLNRAQSQADRSLRDTLQAIYSARSLTSAAGVPYSGFVGDGFRLVPTSPAGLSVQVTAGFGFQYVTDDLPANLGDPDLSGVDDRPTFKPMYLLAPAVFAVPAAPPAGMSRIDIIEARFDRRLEDATTRRVLDASTKDFLDKTILKTLAFALDGRVGVVSDPSPSTAGLSYKIGTPAVTGMQIEPSASPGYVKIGAINVANTTTVITGTELVDRRALLYPGGRVPFSGRWRVQWNGGFPIGTPVAIHAPPSIQVTILPLSPRGSANLRVLGGEIVSATAIMSTMSLSGLLNADRFVVGLPDTETLTGSTVMTLSSSDQSDIKNGGTPSISAGVGSKFARARIQSRFVTNTGTSNNTDVSLEDVMVEVTGSLAYV